MIASKVICDDTYPNKQSTTDVLDQCLILEPQLNHRGYQGVDSDTTNITTNPNPANPTTNSSTTGERAMTTLSTAHTQHRRLLPNPHAPARLPPQPGSPSPSSTFTYTRVATAPSAEYVILNNANPNGTNSNANADSTPNPNAIANGQPGGRVSIAFSQSKDPKKKESNPLPQVPEQVVHNNVACDSCEKTIVGIRHVCLHCPDYDLCTHCIKEDMAAEKRNPFHESFEIHEPGHVVQRPSYIVPPVIYVNRRLLGPATNAAIVQISTLARGASRLPEQHPKHSFVKMEKDQLIILSIAKLTSPDATSAPRLSMGCDTSVCIPTALTSTCANVARPCLFQSHPLLRVKIRNPDVVILTVYRVGGTSSSTAAAAASAPTATANGNSASARQEEGV
ncbi:hypothetical protein DFP72DRAFT_1095446 [Ephemerocybe angulata]|uniref:ZZ-type domain-containing protein n=1 Tax=Ephemerocybe angulata TaxID=980116 RepID=A0A8H6HC56_9AGAR|nr:hypothetical protein DFP72DRAFT_1095446 [Tulosesus angulatus]